MTKASSARNERRGKDKDAMLKAYQAGHQAGINMLAAELAKPAGVLMKDGRVARIVYEAAPEQPANKEVS